MGPPSLSVISDPPLQRAPTRFAFEGHVLDVCNGTLIGPDGDISLRPMTFNVLKALVDAAPAILSREALQNLVWGHQALSDSALAQSITELRAALGDDRDAPKFIQTRHRRGYQFVAKVTRLTEPEPIPAPVPPLTAAIRPGKRRWLTVASVATVLLLGLAWLLDWLPMRASTFESLIEEGRDQAAFHYQSRHWLTSGERPSWIFLAQHLGIDPPVAEAPVLDEVIAALAEQSSATTASMAIALLHLDALLKLERCQEAQSAREAMHTSAEGIHESLANAAIALCFHRFRLAQEHAEAALQLASAASKPILGAQAEVLAARALRGMGELEHAQHLAANAGRTMEAEGEALQAAAAYALQAAVQHDLGRYPDADTSLSRARQIFQRFDANVGLRRLLGLEAALAYRRGDFVKALPLVRHARIEAERAFDMSDAYTLAVSEAEILTRSGDVDAALAIYAELLPIGEESQNHQLNARILVNRAGIASRQGRLEEAQQDFLRALSLFQTLGDEHGEALTEANLAANAAQRNEVALARQRYHHAIAVFRALHAHSDLARNLYNLGLLQRREGDFTAARETLTEAHQTFISLGERDSLLFALAAEAELALWQAAPDEAGALIAEAEQQLTQNPMSEARIATVRGELARQRASAEAAQWFERARDLRRKAHARVWVLASDLDQLRWAVDTGAASESLPKTLALRAQFSAAGERADAFSAGLLAVTAYQSLGQTQAARALLTQLAQEAPQALAEDHWRLRLLDAISHGDRRQLLDIASAATAAGAHLLALEARVRAGDPAARAQARTLGLSRIGNLNPLN